MKYCMQKQYVIERVLGMLAKVVFSPLWRTIEGNEHILNMNEIYQDLLGYFNDNAENPQKILEGGGIFSNVRKDAQLDALLLGDHSDISAEVSCALFTAYSKVLETAMKEHLPGGKYSNPDLSMREHSKSTLAHNKLPESVFGVLDSPQT